jgi:hypothetical protein
VTAVENRISTNASLIQWAIAMKEEIDGEVATNSKQSKIPRLKRRKSPPRQFVQGQEVPVYSLSDGQLLAK